MSVLLPCVVPLFFAVSIPRRLESEIVWPFCLFLRISLNSPLLFWQEMLRCPLPLPGIGQKYRVSYRQGFWNLFILVVNFISAMCSEYFSGFLFPLLVLPGLCFRDSAVVPALGPRSVSRLGERAIPAPGGMSPDPATEG